MYETTEEWTGPKAGEPVESPNARVIRMVNNFLQHPRQLSDSDGLSEVTDDDFEGLQSIIRALIELKCAPDIYSGVPIEVVIVNRRTHESFPYLPVPCEDQCESWEDFWRHFDVQQANSEIAQDKLKMAIKILRIRRAQQKQMEVRETIEEALARLDRPVTEEDVLHENLPLLTDADMRVVMSLDIEEILRKANTKHERKRDRQKREASGDAD